MQKNSKIFLNDHLILFVPWGLGESKILTWCDTTYTKKSAAHSKITSQEQKKNETTYMQLKDY